MTLGTRLRAIRDSLGLSQRVADERFGLGVGGWKQLEAHDRAPNDAAIVQLVELGFSADWLFTGKGEMRRGPDRASTAVGVPFYEELRPAAGGGRAIDNEASHIVYFDETWLRRFYGVGGHEVLMLAAIGESMETLIHAGEPLLIHVSAHGKQLGEGIFIIRHEGVLMVKRLQPLPGRRVMISSENAAYDPFEVHLADEALDFAIIGRVLCVCRRL